MLVKYDFIDIYGIRWTDSQVNRYNDIQKRIQAYEVNGLEASDELKMESFKAYQSPYYLTQGEYEMQKEYIIWGKENAQAEYEIVLVSEQAGIQSMSHAQSVIDKLATMGCVDMRVQVIDFSHNPLDLFAKAVNI